jgi:peroxiredoxin
VINPVRNTSHIRTNTIFSNRVKKISLIALSSVLVQNFLFAAQPLRTETPEIATNFTLLDLENKEFSLSDFKGKPVILFFWTTWCPYCRGELKQLNTMHAQFLRDGVELVAINIEEPAAKVQRFMGSYPFSYRVLLDTDAKVAGAFGVLGVPTYILINKEGCIVFNSNYFPQKEYNDLILK